MRRQRKYRPESQGGLTPVAMTEWLDVACVIELTQIEVDGSTGWTIGLDAIGPVDRVGATMTDCVQQLLVDYPGPALSEDRSFGYPARLLSD